MKIINILFNFKKSAHDNQILGVERCFLDYAKYLVARGHRVVSVLKCGMVFFEETKKNSSKAVEMSAFGQGDVFTMLKMAYLFLCENPDIVICHSGRALFFSRVARLLACKRFKIVVINHGIRVEKFLKADYVFAVNSYFARELVEAGMPEDRALVIPNMIKVPQNFIPLQKQKFHKPLRIGALGRLYPEKNFDKTLRAMSILRQKGFECEYVIGGVGPEQERLEGLAKELNLQNNFKILGWTKDKRQFFDSIDIFILPSFGETFGIVLLEAMLYNTPIITSNSWGPEEVIDHEIDGLKVSKDDAEKMPQLLADAILRLANDEEFAKKLAQKAHQKFLTKYTVDVVITQLEGMLERIIARHK